AKEVSVSINGAAPVQAPAGKVAHFARTGGKWAVSSRRYPSGLVKKHGLSGPVMDVFMGEPVLMVHGTLKSPDKARSQKTHNDSVTGLFGVAAGGGVLHSGFERTADRDVSKEDIAEKNLVLFGTPQTNQLLNKIADKLPVKFLEDGVEIAGKSYRGPDVGLVM